MLHLLLVLLFAVAYCSQETNLTTVTNCGRPNGTPLTARIVGGYDVGYYKYPWFAVLMSDNEVNCGGTLIGPRRVLTAAHCFKPYFKRVIKGEAKLEDIYTIKLGIYNSCLSESSQREYRSAKIDIHENYFEGLPYFDIALITLDGDTEDYKPVCLPLAITQSATRAKEGVAQGLGRLDYNNETVPCTLQEVRLLIHPDNKCRDILNSTDNNNGNTMQHAFCAGYLNGKFDTCLGDSGGPLLVLNRKGRYVLQGITSFGFGCAEKDVLGVYTDVSHFLKWIYERSGIGNKVVSDAEDITSISTEEVKPSTSDAYKEILQSTVRPAAYLLHPPHRRRKKRRRRPYRKPIKVSSSNAGKPFK